MVVADMSGSHGTEAEAKNQKDENVKSQLTLTTNGDEIDKSNEVAVPVEVRGGRTGGALPTSMTLMFAPETTVLDIKRKLADASDASKKLAPSGIKLVFEGRALDDADTLANMVSDPAKQGSLTVFAALATQDNGTKTPQSPMRPAPDRSRSLPASPSCGPAAHSPNHFGARGSSEPSSPGKAAPPTTPSVPGWEEEMRKKIEMNMKKAFWASLEASISKQDNPDYAWITKLYAETRDRLCSLTPRREDIRQQIHSALDEELFERMVKNNAFEPSDLLNMVNFTFERLAGLCSPARDAEVQAHREQLTAMIGKEGTTFAAFAVAYLKAFHETVDNIESDIEKFKQQMQQQQQQQQPSASTPPAGQTPPPSSSSAAGVKELKEKLRQLGLSDEVIGQCVERRELEALLEKALGRAAGTVSGGLVHPSVARAAPPVSRGLDLGSADADKVKVAFSVLSKGASPSVRELSLPLSHTMAQTREALAAVLSDTRRIEPSQLQLVFAGRILGDDETVRAVHRPEAPGSAVHVVIRTLQ